MLLPKSAQNPFDQSDWPRSKDITLHNNDQLLCQGIDWYLRLCRKLWLENQDVYEEKLCPFFYLNSTRALVCICKSNMKWELGLEIHCFYKNKPIERRIAAVIQISRIIESIWIAIRYFNRYSNRELWYIHIASKANYSRLLHRKVCNIKTQWVWMICSPPRLAKRAEKSHHKSNFQPGPSVSRFIISRLHLSMVFPHTMQRYNHPTKKHLAY